MFIRFRQVKADRYGEGERICAGECKNRRRHHVRGSFWVPGRTLLEGCPMKPLCPLVTPRQRLDVSLVETRRIAGKVRQEHIASLGSIVGDTAQARQSFWVECEARLARLTNRIGPDLDRLRQTIAARIPPLTEADRVAIDAEAWNRLEAMWDDYAKAKARESSKWNEQAKADRREATEAEARLLQTKRLRGNWEAFEALNQLLGVTLTAAAMGKQIDHDEIARCLKQKAQEAEKSR
jgi:hypothetical protein